VTVRHKGKERAKRKNEKPSRVRVGRRYTLGVAAVVMIVIVVVIMVMLWSNFSFTARLSQKLGYFAVATLNMDGFSIILQSARSCTVLAVGKSCGFVNDKSDRLQSEVGSATALVR
jgi:hypothetical protein